MYRYVCGLDSAAYKEWIGDRSTATSIKVFENSDVDSLICDPRAWIPLALYSLWVLMQFPVVTALVLLDQALVASIAVMALTLGDLAALSAPLAKLPHRVHFLLFGISAKFYRTDWKTNTLLALAITLVCTVGGYPLATLVVIGVQVYKCHK